VVTINNIIMHYRQEKSLKISLEEINSMILRMLHSLGIEHLPRLHQLITLAPFLTTRATYSIALSSEGKALRSQLPRI
jgi:hypothetical protein